MAKRGRPAKDQQLDTSWFDITKYSLTKNMSPLDWVIQFKKRIDIVNSHGVYKYLVDQGSNEQDSYVYDIENRLNKLKNNPVSLNDSNIPFLFLDKDDWLHDCDTSSIRSLKIFDIATITNFLKEDGLLDDINHNFYYGLASNKEDEVDFERNQEEMLEFKRINEDFNENSNIGEIPVNLYAYFTDCIDRRFINNAFVNVDLTSPDTVLVNDFKHWLVQYRNKINCPPPKKRSKKKTDFSGEITPSLMDQFVDLGVLPYMDLDIVCGLYGKNKPTYHTIAGLIFKEQDDKEANYSGDKIRQETKDLAEWLQKKEINHAMWSFLYSKYKKTGEF